MIDWDDLTKHEETTEDAIKEQKDMEDFMNNMTMQETLDELIREQEKHDYMEEDMEAFLIYQDRPYSISENGHYERTEEE